MHLGVLFRRTKFWISFFIFGGLLLNFPLSADIIILQTGKVITGDILQESTNGVLIKLDYGTFTYPQSFVKEARKESKKTDSQLIQTNRIPDWGAIISALAKQSWATDLKQIPATVIDNGILQNVPYVSFQSASGGYEINIYGDLDRPAGIEIGVLKYLLKNNQAKTNCIEFIGSLLKSNKDKKTVNALGLDKKNVITNEEMTFEITLPIEADSYGGWWVSVYDEKALEQSRASGNELLAITQPRVTPKPQLVAYSVPPKTPSTTANQNWSAGDFEYARPTSSSSTTETGRVYVKGYFRSNGTYVSAHTRGRPRR